MASTTFIDNQTTIFADWLNDANNVVYNGVFVSPTITATSMVCTGTASGVGFTNLINNVFASPGAIGNATPNTGAFTTLSATAITATSITGLTTPLSISQGGTGLSAAGTSGYALASNGTGLVYKKLGLGITGEIWNNVAGSRAFNTTYTNSNAYPIVVNFAGTLQGVSQSTITFLVGSTTVGQIAQNTAGGNTGLTGTISVIVPPSATYRVNCGAGSINAWTELY
jgi:hypothetical protein